MWAEAMGKIEGMESSNRERLWPHLVQGFKDLSQRLKVLHLRSYRLDKLSFGFLFVVILLLQDLIIFFFFLN